MNNKNKSGSQFGASVASGRGLASGMRAHGSWKLWAHAPLLISDPEKFLNVIEATPLDLNADTLALVKEGKLWQKCWNFITSCSFPSVNKELERLLSGGNLKWKEGIENLVVNVGLNDVLDKYFKGSTYTAAHYVGLTDGTPTPNAADTMASHAGWTEVTDYTESVRQTLTLGTVSGQSVDNSGSKAVFSINGTVTVGGAFLATSSTKSETASILYSIGAFTGGDKSLTSGDSLSVQGTFTQADDGV